MYSEIGVSLTKSFAHWKREKPTSKNMAKKNIPQLKPNSRVRSRGYHFRNLSRLGLSDHVSIHSLAIR